MSGHSKFANIAHKKAANDAAKGKIFTRLGKEIMVAVKEGGPDVNNNSKLRQVVAKAKASNMPNDTIDRAIKKAASSDMTDYEQLHMKDMVQMVQLSSLKHLQITVTVQLQISVMHLQRAAVMLVHQVAYHSCSIRKDR